jgi:hypothetical protein
LFPLAKKNYQRLTRKKKVIGLGLALIPFALFYYGPQIRARSHFGKRLAQMAQETAERKMREQEFEMAESQAVGEDVEHMQEYRHVEHQHHDGASAGAGVEEGRSQQKMEA